MRFLILLPNYSQRYSIGLNSGLLANIGYCNFPEICDNVSCMKFGIIVHKYESIVETSGK